MPTNHLSLCTQFFEATASGDATALESLCAEDFTGQQNGGPEMSRSQLIRFSVAVKRALPDFHYDKQHPQATETGFLEEHLVCCTLPDGTALQMPVVVVADVEAGKITAMREYFDSVQARGLMKALSPG